MCPAEALLYILINCKIVVFLYSKYTKYNEPKQKLYTFIIQIANTILNQSISRCPYKIGHITKAIIGLKLNVICHA